MRHRNTKHAYSLIEVVIAGAILMICIAAVTAMALATVTQQETNVRISQALSFKNQTNTTIGGVVGLERVECEVVFQPNPATSAWAEGRWVGGTTDTRANTMIVVRPSLR